MLLRPLFAALGAVALALPVAVLDLRSGAAEPSGKGSVEGSNSLGMTFVRLTKGTFYMGGGGGKAGKKTEIDNDFSMCPHLVTQRQWRTVMGSNPSYFSRDVKDSGVARAMREGAIKGLTVADLNQFPVERVSWDDTQLFIKKLNERERGKGYTYRLPTDAEWEYACRGGANTEEECSFDFYLDRPTNDLSSDQANFNGNAPAGKAPRGKYVNRPTKVDAYKPNSLGLYDMHGNVLQWCQDLYDEKNPGSRVTRGGAFSAEGRFGRAGYRKESVQAGSGWSIGFRLVRVAAASK